MARFMAINTATADTSTHRALTGGLIADTPVVEDGYCETCLRALQRTWNPIILIGHIAGLRCYTLLNERSSTWANIWSAAGNIGMLLSILAAYTW